MAALAAMVPACRSSSEPTGSLDALKVSPGTLQPSFTSGGHDYGIICAEGKNSWNLSATPRDSQSKVTFAGAGPNGQIDVTENQVVTVNVTKPDSTNDTYYVRCLPHDFPRFSITRDGQGAKPGFYLLAPNVNDPNNGHYLTILDEFGAALWYQKTPWPAANLRKLPNGNMYWIPLLGGSGYGTEPDGYGRESNLDGALLHSWKPVGNPPDYHDVRPLPNGDMLVTGYRMRNQVDVSALAPEFTGLWNVVDASLQEILPDGSVAWQWHSEDHIGLTETVAQKNKEMGIDPFSTLDLVHPNSIEVTPEGDLILSTRHTDAVYKIRKNPGQPDDGKIIWKLGGVPPTEKGARHLQIIDDPYGGPARQHWARLLPNGHLTMFDNRTNKRNQPARVVEYELNEEEGTAKMVWQYEAEDRANSGFFGSYQRLPDGSHVIGWGGMSPVLSELTPDGERVLRIVSIGTFTNFSVTKEPPEAFDKAMLRDKAGKAKLT